LEASLGKQFARPYVKKTFPKIRLVEWLKVETLSSSPSTANKQTNKQKEKLPKYTKIVREYYE
jgi:hypothetical protein